TLVTVAEAAEGSTSPERDQPALQRLLGLCASLAEGTPAARAARRSALWAVAQRLRGIPLAWPAAVDVFVAALDAAAPAEAAAHLAEWHRLAPSPRQARLLEGAAVHLVRPEAAWSAAALRTLCDGLLADPQLRLVALALLAAFAAPEGWPADCRARLDALRHDADADVRAEARRVFVAAE
ncbi:MAG: hypothetical protein KC620_22060, partial [Myxococcales bacterium]|nr:hypothetical protein [Myxococcales bacterium]